MSYKPVTFSIDAELLDKLDARARSLGLKRSQYIAQLIRADLLGEGTGLQIVAEDKPDKPYATKPKDNNRIKKEPK